MQILISKNGKRFGPYSEDQVNGYIEQGHFSGSDLAWHKGIPEWTPLSMVLGMKPAGENPPPFPRSGKVSAKGAFSIADIIVVAECQKAMIWLAVASLGALWNGYASLVVGVFSIIFIYRLARSVRTPGAGAYAALAIIPLVGLVILLIVNSEATAALKRRGIRVGLLGANKSDLQKLRAA